MSLTADRIRSKRDRGPSSILPPAGAARDLAMAQLANSVGDGAFIVTSALFFTRVVGLSTAEVGLGLTVAWLVGFLTGVPLGNLADRKGARGVAVALALTTAASVGSFLFVRSFPLFLVAAITYASSQTGLTAARQALLAGLVQPAERTRIRAFLQSTVNGGLAVGAALGGIALRFDTSAAYLTVFAIDAVSFLIAARLIHRVPAVAVSTRVKGEPRLAVLRDRPYAVLALLNAIMLLFMPLLSLVAPLWIVSRTDAPDWVVASLLIVNTLGVTLFQVRIAKSVTDLHTATRSVRYAGVAMLAACGVFAISAAEDERGDGCRRTGARRRAADARRDEAGVRCVGDQLRSRTGRQAGPVPGLLRHRPRDRPHARPGAAHHRRPRLGSDRLDRRRCTVPGDQLRNWSRRTMGSTDEGRGQPSLAKENAA